MLKGKVEYHDEQLGVDVHYEVWGYALFNSLKLVLRPLTTVSESYFTDELEDVPTQTFRGGERLITIKPTNTVVQTTVNEETIKAYPTTRTLPALMGLSYNLLVEAGNQGKVNVQKQVDEFGDISYGINQKMVAFDPRAKEPSSKLKSGIVYPRREGSYKLKAFFFHTDTFRFELEDDGQTNSKKLPYEEAQYTVPFRLDNLMKKLGFIEEEMQELNFDGEERGMFLDTLEEVISRYPNKNLEWIKTRNYTMVTDENLEEVMEYLYKFPHAAVDTETDGLRITFKSKSFVTGAFSNQLVGIIISVKQGEAFFFPVRMRSMPNLLGGDHVRFMENYMKDYLQKIPIILFNAAFDAKVFMIYDIFVNLLMDVMVAFQDTLGYKKGIKKISLKKMTNMFLNRDAIEINELTRTGSYDGADFADVPPNLVNAYACPDSDNTLGLYDYIVEEKVLEEHNAVQVVKLDSHFALCIAYQEFYGQYIDVDELPDLRNTLATSIEEEKNKMYQAIQEINKINMKEGADPIKELDNFNPNSTVQMIKLAYQDFKLPLQRKFDKNTSRYKPTLDKKARKTLLEITNPDSLGYKFIKAFQEYSTANTMVKNFTKNLNTMMSPDGYTFSKVDQFLNTGRISVSEPPYQNYSDSIKHYIRPRPGFGMSDNDYQSIEYKIIAGRSGDERLMEAFQDPNTDYHRLQAANMFKKPYELITGEERSLAKGFNFGIPFGMGGESLGEILKGSRSPENTAYANKMMVEYFKGQDKVKYMFENTRDEAVKNGYSETVMGRRRYYDKRVMSTGSIRRKAGNQPIQGTAADFFKFAVVRFYYYLLKNNLQGKILFSGFIHDEMLIEVHKSIHPLDYLKIVLEQVELRVKGFPPMFIGWGYGANWYQAKKFDIPTELQYELIRNGAEKEYPQWYEDDDCEKFNEWIKWRIAKFTRDQLYQYLTDENNRDTSITSVAWGYLREVIEESEEYQALPKEKQGSLTLDEQLSIARNYLEIEVDLNIQDPSKIEHSTEIQEDDNTLEHQVDGSKGYDVDHYSDFDTESGEQRSYDEMVALREEKYKKEQFLKSIETFGNSVDLDTEVITFKMDKVIVANILAEVSNERTPDKPYRVAIFDKGKINVTNSYIGMEGKEFLELLYIKAHPEVLQNS